MKHVQANWQRAMQVVLEKPTALLGNRKAPAEPSSLAPWCVCMAKVLTA